MSFYRQMAVLGFATTLLSACQSIDTARIKHAEKNNQHKHNALVYCTGTENCEFERLDQIQIIDSKHGKLNSDAIKAGILGLQTKSLKQPNALYLSVKPGQHELVIRFYPISPDRAETLHVIHRFQADREYHFKMFRQRGKQRGSVLNVSAPDPLCVDLQQQRKTIRRFCRPYNVLTGLGEFVEQKI